MENWLGIERAVEARRDQPVHRLTQELCFGPSEQPFDLVIQRNDSAERVYDDRSIRSRVEYWSEPDFQHGSLYHGETPPAWWYTAGPRALNLNHSAKIP
jgi:hypothetical protein